MKVAAIQIATPTDATSLRTLNELLARAVVEGAELAALALRPLPTKPPRAEDPLPSQLRILAHGHGIALCAGPFAQRDEDGAYIAYGLWDGDGNLLGVQRQTHLPASHTAWAQGDTLEPLALSARSGDQWRIGILADEDVTYPEVARILTLQGANILLHLGAMPAPYNPWEQERRLWREVQSNQTFGIESYTLSAGHTGHTRILAPVEMTTNNRGILSTTSTPTNPDLAVATLDEAARREVIRKYPIHKFYNSRMYRALPDSYNL